MHSQPSTLRLAASDGLAALVFVIAMAAIPELSKRLAPPFTLGLSEGGVALALILLLLVGMSPITDALGGALYSPANNAMLCAVGEGSAAHHAWRVVGQAAGGVTGAFVALAVLPECCTRHLSGLAVGLRPGVGLLEGCACEFVLGSLLAFVVLLSAQARSGALRLWVPLLATVVAVKAGERLTGPCLNPVFSLSWLAAFPQQQGMAEHLAVFWAAPVAAGIFGGWAFKGWQQQQQRAAVQGGGSAAKQAGHRAKRD